jgi:tryptophan synthase alpha chain
MSRIQATLAALSENYQKGLIPFITAGDPAPELTVPLMHALVRGGTDILALGVPFCDTMAEGSVSPARLRAGSEIWRQSA